MNLESMHLKKILTLAFAVLMSLSHTVCAKEIHAFIGTYTDTSSKGIYSITLDLETGRLSPATFAAEATNPSFLAYSPDLKSLFAINESGGSVRAFAVEKDHVLRALG
ncbi:MAG: beta-propeller fold lactonase family protein, partial [Ignavibacteriaceae bacterium]